MPHWMISLKETVFYVPSPTKSATFYGHLVAFCLFFMWGWYFILLPAGDAQIGNSFMHYIHLVFHEAGHVIFRPFGGFLTILGGTLGQLLMPLIVMITFIVKNQDNFGASLGLWWLAQSFMDCAVYINDARAGQLILLGGSTGQDNPEGHDWHNLLSRLGWLEYDHLVAIDFDVFGTLLMLIAFLWGGYLLYLQYRELE